MKRRGQSLVEFQAVILLVLTMTFGVVETGRVLLAYVVLADAARAGARYAVVHGSRASAPSGPGCTSGTAPDVVSAAQVVTDAAALSAASFAVCYAAGNQTGDTVTVTATYPFTPLVPLIPLGSFTLSSASSARICY